MRRSTLGAYRLRGDIDLGLEPSRIGADGNQLLARIDAPGGRLPGQPDQSIYEQDTTPNFRIGTRRVVDERTFRYAYAGEALLASYGAQSWSCYSDAANVEDNTIGAAGTATDTYITCTAVGTVTPDMYAGGYALIRWEFSYYRILSNTGATAGNPFTVYLDHPLWEDINVASLVTLYKNPWADTRILTGGSPLWASTVGIPPRDVDILNYYWAQTWGPCGGVLVIDCGAGESERGLYFVAEGALLTQSGLDPNANQPANQYAGFLLPYTGPGPAGRNQPGGFCHFMLQICP